MTSSAEVPYLYSQAGEMMADLIVFKDNNNEQDVKGSLLNYINLLKTAIKTLQDLHDNIPDDAKLKITANYDDISISGPEQLINDLVSKEILSFSQDSEEEEVFEPCIEN